MLVNTEPNKFEDLYFTEDLKVTVNKPFFPDWEKRKKCDSHNILKSIMDNTFVLQRNGKLAT